MSFGYVEDTVRQIVVEIINKIIKEENLPFERADAQIEIKLYKSKQRFPDIIIWKKGGVLRDAAILIELKQPKYVPLNPELVDDAFLKASKVNAPFFATWNMQHLILFDAFERASLMERRKGFYKISSIGHPNEIARDDVKKEFEEGLRKFLLNFTEIFLGNKVIPTIPVDEFFIYNLRSLVDALSTPLTEKIMNVFNNDTTFRRKFQAWFVEQGWNPPLNTEKYYDEFNRSARQYLYLLANKLMFYLVLKTHIPSLPDLNVENANDGENLRLTLQVYFDEAKSMSGDYETIFGMNFIEEFPIPDEIIDSLKMFIKGLSKYDFKRIGYADLGKIFDKLIPEEERHKLGQYFTSQKHRDGTYWPDVVDLIIGFTIKKPDTFVLDGAVGAGTFLVRSYARMKYLKPNLKHNDIISRLYGIDISKFPALLSAINLAIRDLSIKENYPIIINKDFFEINTSTDEKILDKWSDIKQRLLLLTQKETLEQSIPHVDAFIGNPPYTRQEEMEEYIQGYKEKLAKHIKNDWNIEIGARSSIYVYFMLHGIKFLKEGGRIGYITSNSWLDVDYGKYLQEFLLKNTKIIAIIESKAERWFEDADINTVITIAEKCNNEDERNNNVVKFVQLKKRLEDIIPTTNENQRWKAIDELTKLIENANEYYEDDRIRIFAKTQKELWDEGYEKGAREYVGSKWGKYIRAPDIFFKTLNKIQYQPLGQIYQVRKGYMKTPYKAFCLDQKTINSYKIENKFLKPVFSIAKNARYINMSNNSLEKLLVCNKSLNELKGTHLLNYIKSIEEMYPSLKRQKNWWQLKTKEPAQIVVIRTPFDRHIVMLNDIGAYVYDHNEIIVDNEDAKSLCAILNSTLYILYREIFGRTSLGLGTLKLEKVDLEKIPIINVKKLPNDIKRRLENSLDELSKREIKKIFEEIGANTPEEVSLEKIKPDRRELDKIVMGEILGLSEEEQLEVYRAVIDLVKTRIEKAKSVKRNEKKKGINLEQLAEDIIKEINLKPLPNFPDDYLNDLEIAETKNLPSGRKVTIENTLEGTWLNIDEKRIKCSSMEEAKYLRWAALTGKTKVPIPSDTQKMVHITQTFTKEYNQRLEALEKWLKENIPSANDRKILQEKIIEKLLRGK